MQFALATIVLSRYPSDPAFRESRWAKETGFEGIDLSNLWFDFTSATENQLIELRRQVNEHGLRIASLNPFTRMPVGDRAEKDRAALRSTLRAAQALQADVVDVSIALRPDETGGSDPWTPARTTEVWKPISEFLGSLADEAREKGVSLSLELHDGGPFEDHDALLRMLLELGRKNVGVNPDVANSSRRRSSMDWRAVMRLLAPHANLWHVKNYRVLRVGECHAALPCCLWEGDIDVRWAARAMLDGGFDGWVSIESRFGDPLEIQRRNLAYLEAIFSEERERMTRIG